VIFLDGMVPLFNAALNKRAAAKLWKQPLTKKASKSGMSRNSVIYPKRANDWFLRMRTHQGNRRHVASCCRTNLGFPP